MSSKNVGSTEIAVKDKSNQDLMGIATVEDLAKFGFIEEQIIKIGDPDATDAGTGVVPAYAGQIIGKGAPIELANEQGEMVTWQFHPIVPDGKGGFVANTKAIHTVICSAQLASAYARAHAAGVSSGKKVQIFAQYEGQGKNRAGQPLNLFRSAYRLVD